MTISDFLCLGGAQSTPGRIDPSSVPLEQLARIRGAMWSARLNLPYGPRPNQDDNILATDFWNNYTPDEQTRAYAALHARGLTHVDVGPLVDSDGYHGKYVPNDWRGANFDKFLDILQGFWDNGFAPVVFIHPDGWSFEQTRDELTPLLLQPRAQRLIRIAVPTGWEPTRYGWSSYTWAAFCQWGRETLPNALILIHTVADTDAPVGTDTRGDDNGKPNGEGWSRVAPFIHGWLIQNGPYKVSPAQDPTLAKNFGDQFRADVPHSIAWHFAGNAGWPTFSAWGNRPLLLYAGEQTAYEEFWNNLPEPVSQAWGDLAIAAGAAGYLDNGTVTVP